LKCNEAEYGTSLKKELVCLRARIGPVRRL